MPTLVIRGGYDMCTPAIAQVLVDGHRRAPSSSCCEHSAHVPVVEEPERYRAVVAEFLARVEARL